MTLNTILSLFGVGFEIDPFTGIEIDSGSVGLEVDPLTGSTSVDIVGSDIVGVDLTQGVAFDVLGSDIVDVDLVEGADLVDLTEEFVSGVGEELYADLTEGLAIATDDLLEFGITIPTLDI